MIHRDRLLSDAVTLTGLGEFGDVPFVEALDALVDSFNVDAINELGILYDGSAQYADAVRYYRRAVAAEPDNGILIGNLVGTLTNAGRLGEADSVLRDAKARKLPFPMEVNLAPVLYLRGDLDAQCGQ